MALYINKHCNSGWEAEKGMQQSPPTATLWLGCIKKLKAVSCLLGYNKYGCKTLHVLPLNSVPVFYHSQGSGGSLLNHH